ncbi:MAG: lamin tail domain-containing protein [Phycisphaerales bacterium]
MVVRRIARALSLALVAGMAAGSSGQVVISEVYGGGGNAGATYRNDFVELFNRGTTNVSIANWSVQYAASTGTTWQVVAIPAGVTLAPGQHYLIALASGGATGAVLPAANVTGAVNMSATAGKVAVCNSTTALSGACPASAAIVDKVGYGAANCSEGSTAPAGSNTLALVRNGSGCTDTNSNSADFAAAAPNPQNATVITPCGGGGGGGSALRICTWNTTQYSGASATRDPAFKTALYGSFGGRSLAPDVLCAQEYSNQGSIDAFLVVLNTASGSPGDWAAAAFVDGPDLDNVCFYRTSRVSHLGSRVIAVGSTLATNQPRNTMRHDIRPAGYSGAANSIGIYNSHMKSGSAGSDQSRRLVEAQRIRDNAEGVNTNGAGSGLPSGYNFIVLGDFNIQTHTQLAYQELVGSQASNAGRFFDPINTAASWNNNSAYRFVHTQDPANDMDDRLDFILVSSSLVNGAGLDYVGNPSLAYSTTTWNDPNHSYRVWGNDGGSYGTPILTTANSMVGSTIASALITTCGTGATGGHLPVYLDLALPAAARVAPVFIPGRIPAASQGERAATRLLARGETAAVEFTVENAGDIATWSERGITDLLYKLDVQGAATLDPELYREPAAAGANTHRVALDTSTIGRHHARILIAPFGETDAPAPLFINFEVYLPGDLDRDGVVSDSDLTDLVEAMGTSNEIADLNRDGAVDASDLVAAIELMK